MNALAAVKREMLVAIIFGGFENITIWRRFNLEISLKESGCVGGSIFFHLVKLINSPISPNKSSQIIYRFTVCVDHTEHLNTQLCINDYDVLLYYCIIMQIDNKIC